MELADCQCDDSTLPTPESTRVRVDVLCFQPWAQRTSIRLVEVEFPHWPPETNRWVCRAPARKGFNDTTSPVGCHYGWSRASTLLLASARLSAGCPYGRDAN